MAGVTAPGREPKQYIGMTEHELKRRYNTHKQSINNAKYENSAALSKHVWDIKRAGVNCSIKWSVIKHAKAYVAGSRKCDLCQAEKLCIINADKGKLLNKISELISKCRHEDKFYASNYKPA